MTTIGIVGLGISGLQLGLYLQRAGVESTLYSAVPPDALQDGQALNYAIRWAPTLRRENSLGLVADDPHLCRRLRVRGPDGSGVDFTGALATPGDGTDFRIYLPWLLENYLARGGRLRVEPCGPAELPTLLTRHEVAVVAAGRGGFGGLFAVDRARTPHNTPARRWTVATYDGLDTPPDCQVEMNLVPGAGEVLHMQYRSRTGVRSVLAIGAIPGQSLDAISEIPFATAPERFAATVLETLRVHVPHVRTRVDAAEFAPTDRRDVIQAPITPTVRRAWATLDDRVVLAIGDAWILNDPLAAQGANLGSRTAFTVGAAITAGGPYDRAFAEQVGGEMWEQAEAPCALSNALLGPPPPPVLEVLVQAGRDQELADRIADGFGHPEQMLALLAPTHLAA